MEIDTQNGLFANSGHGGGVFNLNTAFGSTDTPSQVAIGALPVMTIIPEHCRDSPGFRKEEQFIRQGEAKLKCDYCATPEGRADEYTCGGYTTHSDCMERVVRDYLWNWSGAVNKFCPKDRSNIPREVTSSDPCDSDIAIKNVQYKVGADPDGDWGPLSQEAYDLAKSQNGNTWCDYVPGCQGKDIWGNECGSAESPTPVPVPAPQKPTEPPTGPVPVPKAKTTQASVVAIGGVLALLGVTIYAISQQQKG